MGIQLHKTIIWYCGCGVAADRYISTASWTVCFMTGAMGDIPHAPLSDAIMVGTLVFVRVAKASSLLGCCSDGFDDDDTLDLDFFCAIVVAVWMLFHSVFINSRSNCASKPSPAPTSRIIVSFSVPSGLDCWCCCCRSVERCNKYLPSNSIYSRVQN